MLTCKKHLRRSLAVILAIMMSVTGIVPMTVFAESAATQAKAYAKTEGDVTSYFVDVTFSEEISCNDEEWDALASANGFGTGAVGVLTDNVLTITLGEDKTIAVGDSIDFSAANYVTIISNSEFFTESVEVGGTFATTAKVVFDIAPKDAVVTDDEGLPFSEELSEGTYNYIATRENYEDKEGSFEVFAEDLGTIKNVVIELTIKMADESELQAAYDAATEKLETLKEEWYGETYNDFVNAVAAAKLVLDADNDITKQGDVDNAKVALDEADVALELLPADYSALEETIAMAEAVDAENYTAKTYENVLNAVNAAKALSNEIKIDEQSVIDEAENAIIEAVDALVEVTDLEFTATAVSTDIASNYGKADTVIIVFSSPTNKADIIGYLNIENAVITEGYWDNDGVVYTAKLGTNTLTNGAKISYIMKDNVMTSDGKVINSITDVTIVGNLEGAEELVTASSMTATIVKGNAKPFLTAEDAIYVAFNAPTVNNAATVNFNIAGSDFVGTAVDGTYYTVYRIALEDNSQVVDGAEIEYNGIKTTLCGSFGIGEKTTPKILRAVAVDVDGTALTKGDRIYVYFDRAVNVSGTLDGATYVMENVQTLVITVDTLEVENGGSLDISSLTITDEFDNYEIAKDAKESVAIEGSFGVAIDPAVTSVTAISTTGNVAASAGDIIRIAFNTKMREDALDRAKISFVNGHWGTGASIAWDTIADASAIIITLGEKPDIKIGKTVVTLAQDFYEVSGVKKLDSTTVENREITGIFGYAVTPELLSASIVKRDTTVGAQEGDEIVLLFNTSTNAADIIALVSTENGFGTNYDGEWTNNDTTYVIKLGSNPTVVDTDTITFTNIDGLLKDVSEQKSAKNANNIILGGSFGTVADPVGISPSAVTATIVKNGNVVGAQAGDKVVLVFNVATNGADIVKSLENSIKYGDLFGTNAKGEWTNGNTVYTVTLGEGATINDASTIEVEVKDAEEINAAVLLNVTKLIGSFGTEITPVAVTPKLIEVIVVKGSAQAGAQAGDIIKFVFNMETNAPDGLYKNFIHSFTSNVEYVKFGTGAKCEWIDNDTVYAITLGEGANLDDGTVMTLGAEAGLRDKTNTSAAFTSNNIEITSGTFGKVESPVLLSASIIKATAKSGSNAGDKIVLVFNAKTNGADITNALGFGVGENAGYEWSNDNTTLTVTLGEGASVTDASKINISSEAGLTSYFSTAAVVTVDDAKLNGSFGIATEVKLLNATIVKADEKIGSNAGDKIVLVFNAKTNGADITNALGLDVGENAVGEWTGDDTIFTVILGEDASIEDGAKITIEESAGLMNELEDDTVVANGIALSGSFGKSIELKPVAAVAYSEGEFDYVNVAFNAPTNGALDNTTNLDKPVHIITNYNQLGSGYVLEWQENNTILNIKLGAGYTLVSGTVLNLNTEAIENAYGEKLADSNSTIKVTGVVKAPVVTKIVADKVGENDSIIITFSSKTNRVSLDLTAQSTNLGVGATYAWSEDGCTLTITLGKNYSIDQNGSVVLNGLGIKDGFSEKNEVVGQYKVSVWNLEKGGLEATRVMAYRNLTENKDFLIVTFNVATNKNNSVSDNLAKTDVDAIVKAAEGFNFGTDYSAMWVGADKLIITLSEDHSFAAEDVVATGAAVTFTSALTTANGVANMPTETYAVVGSFDGRDYVVTEIVAVESANNTKTVDVIVDKQNYEVTDDVIVSIVAWAENTVVAINAAKVNIEDSCTLQFRFSDKDITRVEAYVTSEYLEDIGTDTNTTETENNHEPEQQTVEAVSIFLATVEEANVGAKA